MTETQNLLLFRKWDLTKIDIKDPGLKNVISLKKEIMPISFGRSALKRFNKAEVNIVERLINKLSHFGKKYAKNTGRMGGKKIHAINTVKAAFEIIHRSEEHTSELQSRPHLVCRLLLEKKKLNKTFHEVIQIKFYNT